MVAFARFASNCFHSPKKYTKFFYFWKNKSIFDEIFLHG
nr:MAG TPA: hypothetical protein [Caudoviricetes sp.]